MTWVKICGTTNLADAQLAVAAGADALGFIFAPSPRRIEPAAAAEITAALPASIAKIGVMVNVSPEDAASLAQSAGLTGVQLHGDEPADQFWAYRSALAPRMVIKTLHTQALLAGGDDLVYQYLHSSEFIDAVLLDSGNAGQLGGTGVPFDWDAVLPLVSRIKQWVPVIIAGGLTPDNVGDAIRRFDPWGVDVVSGVECEAGKKNETKLRAFVQGARSTPGVITSQG